MEAGRRDRPRQWIHRRPLGTRHQLIGRDNATVIVNEGQTANNSGTWSDANAGDTVTLTASVGTLIKSGTNAAGTWSWSLATTDGPEQSQTVTITANDGTTTAQTTFALTVANLAPSITKPGTQTADEGTSAVFDLGSFTDPGDDDPWSVSIDWDDGSTDTTFTQATAGPITDQTHTYADDGVYLVTITVREEPGTVGSPSDIESFQIAVANLAPVVTLSGDSSANEGQTKTYTYTITDAGADTVAGRARTAAPTPPTSTPWRSPTASTAPSPMAPSRPRSG